MSEQDIPAEREEKADSAISRRETLGLAGLAGLGMLSGQAAADDGDDSDGNQPWRYWRGDVDADGNGLYDLGALGMSDAEPIIDFAGEGLSIDEGELHARAAIEAATTANFVDIDDYGADPTGEEPSDEALAAAIEDLSDGDYLLITNGEYWFDDSHEIYDDYVTVLGTGSKIRISGVEYGAYSHWLSFGDWTAVSDFGGDTRIAEDVSEGDQAIDVEDPSPFSVGDDITISESKYDNEPTLSWGGTAGRGTCPTRAVIREIDGSTLHLDRGLNYDHDAGTAGVFRLDSVVGGRFVNLHMAEGDGENKSEGFLMCAYARDCAFINCTAEEYVGFPFTDIHSLRTLMIDCEAKNPILPDGRASSHWEPFQLRGSTDPVIVRPSIDTCRRGIDINAGSKVVRVFEPRIRNAYLHGMCFHSNATQPVFGAYEVYGGRVEAAEEVLHDKYHFGAGLSMSPNQSHVKVFGTTVVGRSRAIHTPYGKAENLTLEGCTLETFASDVPETLSTGTTYVINGNLRDSRLENVDVVARGGNDSRAVNLSGAENVHVSGQASGSVEDDVVYAGNARNVTLDVDVLDNENENAPDVTIEDARNVKVTGTLHGAGRSVATAGDVTDVRILDVDAEGDVPPIGHVGGDGSLTNVWVTGCNATGGGNSDIDFESGLDGDIHGLWIQNNVCGEIAFRGSAGDEDKFVTGNLTGQHEEREVEEMEGAGTEDDPYVVENVDHLQQIDEEPGAHYVLGNDVDASATEDWNVGDGFEPIGGFSGTLDGNGHAIEGLYIDRPQVGEVGIFSKLQSGAEIRNLSLVNVDVTGAGYTGGLVGVGRSATIENVSLSGSVTGNRRTGGLAGWHEGTVENVDVDATVDSSGNSIAALVVAHLQPGASVTDSTATGSITTRSESGGIAGWNEGVVENCHSEITLDATDTGYSGGLVGIVINGGYVADSSTNSDVSGGTGVGAFVGRIYGGVVESCAASGTVTGDEAVGGFVGQNDDVIRDCYADASVHATDDQAGGFVGAILSDSSVSTSYAVGEVSGNGDVGGLAGANGGTLADSYWDTETTGQSDGVGSGDSGGEGLTTDEMTGDAAAENMSAFDFEGTWTTTSGYPQLAWE